VQEEEVTKEIISLLASARASRGKLDRKGSIMKQTETNTVAYTPQTNSYGTVWTSRQHPELIWLSSAPRRQVKREPETKYPDDLEPYDSAGNCTRSTSGAKQTPTQAVWKAFLTGWPLGATIYRSREKKERRGGKARTQELWMGRRRGEPQQTASSVGTTAGRHSQKGRKHASRQDEGKTGSAI